MSDHSLSQQWGEKNKLSCWKLSFLPAVLQLCDCQRSYCFRLAEGRENRQQPFDWQHDLQCEAEQRKKLRFFIEGKLFFVCTPLCEERQAAASEVTQLFTEVSSKSCHRFSVKSVDYSWSRRQLAQNLTHTPKCSSANEFHSSYYISSNASEYLCQPPCIIHIYSSEKISDMAKQHRCIQTYCPCCW